MDNIQDYIAHRDGLLKDSVDETGFVRDSDIIPLVLASLLEAKLVDSAEPNDAYYLDEQNNHKVKEYHNIYDYV